MLNALLGNSKILEIYSLYSTSTLTPVVPLNNALSRKSLDSYNAYGKQMASGPMAGLKNRVLGCGISGAQLGARIPATLFLLPEFFVGTGQNPTPNLDLSTKKGREQHVSDLIRHPTYTGTAGIVLGAGLVVFAAEGAIVGGLVGATAGIVNKLGKNFLGVEGGAINGIIKPSASVGALIGAGIGCVICASDALTLNSTRLVLVIAKLLAMLPFAAMGFVAGCLYGAIASIKITTPKDVDNEIEMLDLSRSKGSSIKDDDISVDGIEMQDMSAMRNKGGAYQQLNETAIVKKSEASEMVSAQTETMKAQDIPMTKVSETTMVSRRASWS